MSQQPPSPYVRGFRTALEGMKMALRSKEVGRAYLRVAAVIFGLTVVIDIGAIWTLLHFTTPAADAATWMIVALWVARVIGTLAALLVGPLLAIFVVNIAFPVFNKGVFLAGMQLVDPERAAALEAKPGMPLAPTIGIPIWRLIKFVGLSMGLFVLGLIPVIGSLVATALQLWLTARTIAWELMDPYFDCLDIRYAEQREFVARLQKPLLGFGVPVALLMAIPIVGPLCFGLAQASAGVFVAREFPVDPREAATPTQA
jgi:CysZ protein